MPVSIEYNSLRRMSTITVPKQDINFDAYDFQLCQPQNDIKNAFESRELEATFCRDFACCGLVLDDLHDLLQHYEECHVRLEDDDGSLYDESEYWTPSSSTASSVKEISTLKKKAAAYLSDLYNSSAPASPTGLATPSSYVSGPLSTSPSHALELLTQSAVKKLALATGDLPTPILTDEDFLAQAGALLASANANAAADKPYKCPVPGCDKAYKNPNGLKYHNQHGHCNLVTDENENMASKPYQCTIGDCGKRYKNLNGLKYHIEHSHMAALNHTLATIGSSFFQQQQQQAALSALTSPTEFSPEASPILPSAALPCLF
ncbi:uncharacterized protein BYT42DRAFT_534437 [Radiomyces spectabilis]|uniref:uncharacterized protein n=1 Tax=Radiomyces spectabilis TaxID=64574 RepID=UPI00222010DA|nr:uncharacterized protein BYT42DRAFT_534437 [Radiomyces spectabilis]KAI8376209.1 hypothetical protein BYT42DRAFT_534437 [Radiomyces spectabilis]